MMTPRKKPKSKSDTRSVPIPDDLWDTAARFGSQSGGIPRAAVIRQAMQKFFEDHQIPITITQEKQ